MSEETPAVEASHDDNAAPSTATEVEVTATAETDASATETTEGIKKPDRFQTRINQLTTKNHNSQQRASAAEQRNVELEERIKSLESKPAESSSLVAPDPDEFDTDQEYQAANANYYGDVAAEKAEARISANNEASAVKARADSDASALTASKAKFEEFVTAREGEFEDLREHIYSNELSPFLDPDLANQILQLGEKGVDIVYHLSTNLDVAAQLHSLTPVQRARELTKLEFQVEALNPKKVSDAPDPITPLGNSEAVESDPDKMSADEWQDWRNKQLHG